MIFSHLNPIEKDIEAINFPIEKIGGQIKKHTQENGFPDLDEVKIALFTIDDLEFSSHYFRHHFYNLYPSIHWNHSIADLGILPFTNISETNEQIKEITNKLISKGITPLILGKHQELTYGMYRAYDNLEQQVNLVCIDALFDFGNAENFISQESYMTQILTETPSNLHHFANLGYQTYYNPKEATQMLDKMKFEYHRLGEVANKLELAEPILRNADLISLDMSSIEACNLGIEDGYPNGFSNREICAIARYVGLGIQISSFGIFEIPHTQRATHLLAQIVWYFIEGQNFQLKEYPSLSNKNFTKYIVMIDENLTIEFFQSNLSGRWWILPEKSSKGIGMLPCNESDYIEACNKKIPNRWVYLYR